MAYEESYSTVALNAAELIASYHFTQSAALNSLLVNIFQFYFIYTVFRKKHALIFSIITVGHGLLKM